MISKKSIKFFLVSFSAASLWLVSPVQAQFGQSYNQYGGGYNQYGSSSYGNSYGSSSYGNNRYGGSNYGSSYGSSSYGSSGFGSSGFGSNSFGSSSRRSSRRSSRSSRSSRNSGYGNQNYGNQTYGGNVSNSATVQGGQARKTSPTGNSTDQRRALSGKSNVRGAMSGSSAKAKSTNLSAAKSKTASKKRKEPEVKMRSTATLYMDCPSPMAVVNQPKTVSIILTNSSLEYDHLSFALQYDPDDVMPISGQDAAGEWIAADKVPMVAPDASDDSGSMGAASTFVSRNLGKYEVTENSIDLQTGEIRFEMNVKDGASKEGGEIAQLVFLPLRETNTTVSFLFQDLLKTESSKPLTQLSLANTDQLGSKHNDKDGVINIDLNIFDSLEKARKRMVVKKSGDGESIDDEDQQSYETKLSLVSSASSLDVGDTVEIDVVLSNPGGETFDAVNLLIAYNPRVFEAVDGDDFSPGVNIADQAYKDKFPLDFPILNVIDEEKGIIDYRKKSMRKSVNSEGVIATIKLRSILPTKKTTFRLFLSESGEEPTTGVFFRHKDRLGDPTDPYDGVSTCSLAVRPTTAFLKQFR